MKQVFLLLYLTGRLSRIANSNLKTIQPLLNYKQFSCEGIHQIFNYDAEASQRWDFYTSNTDWFIQPDINLLFIF